MSIRRALIGAMMAVLIVATVLVGALGATGIADNVRREAQQRVQFDLAAARRQFDGELRDLAERLVQRVDGLPADDAVLDTALSRLRQELNLDVLNVCSTDGEPIAGTFGEGAMRVPVAEDGVLDEARRGALSWATVKHPPERLLLEGGPELRRRMVVRTPDGEDIATAEALYHWIAAPLVDERGAVRAIIYGGRSLNHNLALVDELRELVFGARQYDGKPIGTVTIFLDGTRVATNVLGPNRQRALGTTVSDEVREQVLGRGETWLDRAWVVDAWYISAYEPLRDPAGETIGMLYVGLLDAPYTALRTRLMLRFLALVVPIGVIAIIAVTFIVNRITRPLGRLGEAAAAISRGEWDHAPAPTRSYRELNELQHAFAEMQQAIRERDERLRARNEELQKTNEELERVNRNYMQMLGFITHELRSPLGAMQSMINVVTGGYAGDVPESIAGYLQRISRNCEELQDMVKNYLDLSRLERGVLEAHIAPIELKREVVDIALNHVQGLFESRGVTLEVSMPESLEVEADPALLRIVLSNYLSNAAKYGREGGRARLTIECDGDLVRGLVWNEGGGFTEEERQQLFQQFKRLQNETTRGRKGSGLGLFLCRHIMELHGGRVWARSEPGAWAEFGFEMPQRRAAEASEAAAVR